MASFAPQPIYDRGKNSRYQLNRRPGGLRRWYVEAVGKTKGVPSAGYESTVPQLLYRSLGQHTTVYNYNKGKAIPLQAWTGSEGSRSLRLPDFKTIGT